MSSQSFQANMDNITPVQQMVASCSGALLTSLFGGLKCTRTELLYK